MDALYFLMPAALMLSGLGLWMFFWAVGHAQFDDLEGPRWKVVFDDQEGEA